MEIKKTIQKISAKDLDKVIVEIYDQKSPELVLVGPNLIYKQKRISTPFIALDLEL
jgi:cellobiose-specific phosphotransferase system component IIB